MGYDEEIHDEMLNRNERKKEDVNIIQIRFIDLYEDDDLFNYLDEHKYKYEVV